MSLGADNILNLLLDSLTVEELEAVLQRKKGVSNNRPEPMTEKELLSEEYRKRMLVLGILHPPKSI